MISKPTVYLDYREAIETKKRKYQDLTPHFRAIQCPVEVRDLPFGDASFEGNGPNGPIEVGIERKRLHDVLKCIDDGRLGWQLEGMKGLYTISILLVEGHWRPHAPEGWLMEGFHDGASFGYCKPGGSRLPYTKLSRFLITVQLSGVIVCCTRDPFHTAYTMADWFHYFQKSWDAHQSLLKIPKMNIPTLGQKVPLVRKWAADIEGVGIKLSADAQRLFKTPQALANSTASDWIQIPRIGPATALDIIKQIDGRKR